MATPHQRHIHAVDPLFYSLHKLPSTHQFVPPYNQIQPPAIPHLHTKFHDTTVLLTEQRKLQSIVTSNPLTRDYYSITLPTTLMPAKIMPAKSNHQGSFLVTVRSWLFPFYNNCYFSRRLLIKFINLPSPISHTLRSFLTNINIPLITHPSAFFSSNIYLTPPLPLLLHLTLSLHFLFLFA